MLSTTDLLACHHDAKLPRRKAAHEIVEHVAVRRKQAPFRAGLHVKMDCPSGRDRRAVASWAEAGAVTFEDA